MLYHLPRILHLLPEHRAENHLNVLDEGIVPGVPLNNMMTDLIPPIKRLHGGIALLRDTITLQHLHDGNPDNFQVCHQRHMIHIPHVQFEFLRPADGIAPMTLRPTRDARSDFMPTGLLF